jgi:hypothetical protein
MTQEVYVHTTPGQYSAIGNKYRQENIVEKLSLNKIEPLRVELETFLDCCLTGDDFPVTLEQAADNIRICDRIEMLLA